ncbi:hypothetical protein TNCV_3421431 [Trichonephila clavipes]|nr:hypothetical protein TNCV_3421431 [Trichonephila clavipes]
MDDLSLLEVTSQISGQALYLGGADEVRSPKEEMPCVLIGRSQSTQKVGVKMDWVDSKINDPKQGDLGIKFQYPIE